MEPHFEIKTSFDDDSLVLWARGELDLGGRQLVLDAAAPGLVQGQNVILDLSDLTFIDASGIRALVACANAAACARTQFAVRQASGQVARVITMTGLADLIVGHPAETPAPQLVASVTTAQESGRITDACAPGQSHTLAVERAAGDFQVRRHRRETSHRT